MSRRIVYGNDTSENGWPIVDEGSCNWVTVPGTNVSLEIQQGQPTAIMRAFAADFNAYVEPLRDADSGSWTATNSVSTSNHLGGTAMDLNWNSHPFRILNAGFTSEQINTVSDLLEWYEGTIFWGNNWDSPKDAMHFQMGYDTCGNPHTQDFINRKIRADGYSMFRRGGNVTPAPQPTVLTVPLMPIGGGLWSSPSPAWAHLIMRESSGNPTVVQNGYVDVNTGGNEAEGLFQITPATWRAHNGTDFAPSARFATPQQQALVAARIFTRNPTGSDWGAGLPGREDASQLAAGLVLTDLQPADPVMELLMSDLSVESLSIYATPGEPLIPLVRMVQSIDAADHRVLVESAARLGDGDSLARIARTAAGQGKFTDPATVNHAKAVLADIEKTNPNALTAFLAAKGQP